MVRSGAFCGSEVPEVSSFLGAERQGEGAPLTRSKVSNEPGLVLVCSKARAVAMERLERVAARRRSRAGKGRLFRDGQILAEEPGIRLESPA